MIQQMSLSLSLPGYFWNDRLKNTYFWKKKNLRAYQLKELVEDRQTKSFPGEEQMEY